MDDRVSVRLDTGEVESEPGEVNAVTEEVSDEEKLMVDSGAVTHVCPPSWAPGVVPTKSERPLTLKVASGERLKDYGQKKVKMETQEANVKMKLAVWRNPRYRCWYHSAL